jgi:hypothetical protein
MLRDFLFINLITIIKKTMELNFMFNNLAPNQLEYKNYKEYILPNNAILFENLLNKENY